MKKQLIAGTLALCAAGMAGATGLTFKWVGGSSTDWTSEANYEAPSGAEYKVPAAGDIVSIPAETTAKLLGSDSASVALVSALERIAPAASTSHIEINVGEGDSEITLGCGVNKWTGYVSNSRDYGGIIKTGAGSVVFNRTGRDLYTTFDIREGSVKLANSGNTYFLENIILAENATFFANPGGYTSTGRMSGCGTVTNSASQVFQIDEKDRVTVFDGVFSTRIYLYAGGDVTLNGTSNNINNFTVRNNNNEGASGAHAEVKSFGKSGGLSTVGPYQNVFMAGTGAYLRYGGSGETTDKVLYVNGDPEYAYYMDGGVAGGLVLNGGISFPSADSDYEFHLTGSNSTPCVLGGPIVNPSEGSGSASVNLIKDGTGTWRMTNNGSRLNKGDVEIRNGTLQADSLKEKNVVCSIGTGKNIILGDDDGNCGILEYTGTDAVKMLTRKIGLKTAGGFKSDAGQLRVGGVSMYESGVASTLVLDGAAGSTNELQNVSDSDSISIVKKGEGTWTISGDCDASGKVEVQEGTLVARDPKLYRWYRFNIKKLYNKMEGAVKSANGNFMLWVFGLYDADGNWITAAYPQHGDDYALGTGSAGFVSSTFEGEWEYVTGTYGCLTNAFVDSVSNSSRCAGCFKDADGNVLEPDPEDEDTWGRIVIRVADDAPPIVSYDFVQSGYSCWASPRDIVTWSLDASVDGITWEEVSATEDARSLWASSGNGTYSYFWYYGREKYEVGQASSHTTGKAIDAYSTSNELPTPLASVSSVSVAAGATFKSAGAARPVSTLSVNASGMGTLEGVSFGEEGTLEVTGAGHLTAPLALPGTYANTTGIANLAAWSLKMDGVAKDSFKIVVDTSAANPVIRICPPPMMLLIK